MDETVRVVVLGKTGAGKSNLANTIFKEEVFKVGCSANSETGHCQSFTKLMNGWHLKWIDTPGFFDTNRPEKEMKDEILKCIKECHPGPHVFLIVLKLERFTTQEQEIIQTIRNYFSEQVWNFAIVLFTHGDDLGEGMTIQEFARKNQALTRLMQKCGDRCHVVDNRHWWKNQDGYRSNKYQLIKLFETMEHVMKENQGQYYTNEFLQQTISKIMIMAYRLTAGALLMAFLGHAVLETSV